MGYFVPIICEEIRVPEVDLPVRVFSSDAGPAKGCQTLILFDFDMLVINMQEWPTEGRFVQLLFFLADMSPPAFLMSFCGPV